MRTLRSSMIGIAVFVAACGGQTGSSTSGAADPCGPEPSDDGVSSCIAWQESDVQSGTSAPVVLHFTLANPASGINVVEENVTTPDGTAYALMFSVASSVGAGETEAFPITNHAGGATFGAGNTSLALFVSSCSTSSAPSCVPGEECVPSNEPTCNNGTSLVEMQDFSATVGDVTCDASATRQACRFTNLALTLGEKTGAVTGWIHTPK